MEAAMSGVDFLLGKTLIEAVIVNKGHRLEAGSMHLVFFSGHICSCVQRFEGKVIWKSDFLLSAMHNMHLNFININNLCQPDLETMSFTLRMSILSGYHLQRLLLWCSDRGAAGWGSRCYLLNGTSLFSSLPCNTCGSVPSVSLTRAPP